jgi:N-acetylneuraminic acid mutarotase
MKKQLALFLLITLTRFVPATDKPQVEIEPLPAPVTNNAVATFNGREGLTLYSFMGMGPKKTWNSVSNSTYVFDVGTGKWAEARPVPGTAGRLGASAVSARSHIFLFGGYVLDAQGAENTVSDVNVYEPLSDRWYRGEDMPTPVSAAMAGVYKDRYIYIVGGWSKNGPVQTVQIYDAEKNQWLQGTPTPGAAVFGHAGGVVDDTVVYIDGAMKNPAGKPAFIASDECWMGKIDKKDPAKITWSKLPAHPGNAHFRIAAGGSAKDDKVYFTGGSARPYDTFGTGFDGQPAEPSATLFAWNLHTTKWEVIDEPVHTLSMDQRGLLVTSRYLVLLGGMAGNRQVTAGVIVLPKEVRTK